MPGCLGGDEDGAPRQDCHDSYAAHFHELLLFMMAFVFSSF